MCLYKDVKCGILAWGKNITYSCSKMKSQEYCLGVNWLKYLTNLEYYYVTTNFMDYRAFTSKIRGKNRLGM